MKDLLESDYPAYFGTYINHVQNDDCIVSMEENLNDFVIFIENISIEKYNYKYQENKWTIKDIVRHIIDTERIFAYRALRFARFDRTPISGFEENAHPFHHRAGCCHWRNESGAVVAGSPFWCKPFARA